MMAINNTYTLRDYKRSNAANVVAMLNQTRGNPRAGFCATRNWSSFKIRGASEACSRIPNFAGRASVKNLMIAAFNAFYHSGKRRVILDTDSQSFTDSSKFYTSLGMNIYRREFLYEKEIRAGIEIRRLER